MTPEAFILLLVLACPRLARIHVIFLPSLFISIGKGRLTRKRIGYFLPESSIPVL